MTQQGSMNCARKEYSADFQENALCDHHCHLRVGSATVAVAKALAVPD